MTEAARARRVAIVATGDELLYGAHADTNSAEIARELDARGFQPLRATVLGDDEDELVTLLLELAPRCGAILVSGGLGPTLDDVTRHACARAAKVDLVRDERVLAALAERYARGGRPLPAANERQALFPRGADVLANPYGTAAGFALEVQGALVVALPGPPREMRPMFAEHALPRILARARDLPAVERRSLYLQGLAESAFADLAGAWMARDANPLVGVTAHAGRLTVTVRASGANRAAAAELADARAAELRARCGGWLYSEDEPDLARVLGRELIARGVRIATAESCTGGLVAQRLTQAPGSSAVFERGWVTYSNASKCAELGVDPRAIERHGAVSAETAAAMARGAAERSGARLALAVTGIAGPDGGTPEKPVGLVWLATSFDGAVVTVERRFLDLGRDLVREFATGAALDLARRALLGLPAR